MTKILLLLSVELATWLRIAAARQNISRVEFIRRVLTAEMEKDEDGECTCSPDPESPSVCPACKKFLDAQEIEF